MDPSFKKAAQKNLANKMYQPSDYQSQDKLEQSLAFTHEQVSDTYVEGSIDAMIENDQGTGKDEKIPKEGYERMFKNH